MKKRHDYSIEWVQDHGVLSHSPPEPAQHVGKGFSTTTAWKGSCKQLSTVPPRFVELRKVGKSVGVARHMYSEEVAKNAYRRALGEQDESYANSYQKNWFGKRRYRKGNSS